jgi:hypothetical protein
MALPWIVALLFGGIPASISATYYVAQCITPFMGILIAASVLLISYRGYTKLDDIILTCAGICGLLICLCPCTNYAFEFVGTFMLPPGVSGAIHNISAIIFFGLLSYNSLFLFTKSNGEMTKKKKIRNIIYRICGIGMIASFGLVLVPVYFSIWLTETVALSFFGISFLTKADVFPFLFCDTSYKEGDD